VFLVYRACFFKHGTTGTSISSLTINMLFSKESVSFFYGICTHCSFKGEDLPDRLDFVLNPPQDSEAISVWMNSTQNETHEKCPVCRSDLKQPIFFNEPPRILVFDIQSSTIKLDKKIKFVHDNQDTILKLRGIVYYGNFHFTAQIVSTAEIVWYHDGMTTDSTMEKERKLKDMDYSSLLNCRGKKLTMTIYGQEQNMCDLTMEK
jgi:hypothetical protein